MHHKNLNNLNIIIDINQIHHILHNFNNQYILQSIHILHNLLHIIYIH